MRAQGDSPPHEACISVRLLTGSGAAAPDSSLWESDSPAVCLILDLIAASEGVLMASQKGVLVTGFPSFQSAVMAARRLQWAIQGFSEAEEAQAASLALLIHTPEETTGETAAADVLHSLEEAAPGAILLTEKASQLFENLPGFPLQAASGEGLRELEWRGPESQSTRSFDEEILARLTAEQGAPDQYQEQPRPPEAAPAAAGGAEDLEQLRSGAGRGKSRWLAGSLAVAALVLAAGATLYLFRGKLIPATNQAQARTQAPAQTTTPAPTQVQSAPAPEAATAPAIGQLEQAAPPSPARPAPAAGTGHAETPAAAKAAKNLPKVEVKPPAGAPEKQAPKAVEPPAVKVNNAHCDLEPSQYSGQIDQAWKNLGRGRYADAKREFSAVLACDPNNAGAKVGLERARMAASQADGVHEN